MNDPAQAASHEVVDAMLQVKIQDEIHEYLDSGFGSPTRARDVLAAQIKVLQDAIRAQSDDALAPEDPPAQTLGDVDIEVEQPSRRRWFGPV